MKNPKIENILNLVRRPSRYINGELNSHTADMSADFSVCLCFPDIYEVGASNLGLEILYHLVNEKKLARCERAFAPDEDLEKILRDQKIPLFSLESNSDLKSFDIVGFTIQCELVATNIINMLDLSEIPVFSRDRKDCHPLILGGGPALTNPEPFCDFFDAFVLGDGEEVLPEIIETRKKFKKSKRADLLKELSKIDGVYVPSLYKVEYNDDNTVKSVLPFDPDVKKTVTKRTLNLENAYFPSKKIVPFVETVHNRLNIEVARGCPGQCRFCQASKYYRPWRQRPVEKLLELVKNGVESTGYEEIAFSSLSCSDYKHLEELLVKTNEIYAASNLNISLPSLRCNERSLKAAQYINRSKRPTLTFAPEAGSDRLRDVIGKYLSEKQIVETLLSANAMGWKVIKLYFMIGLPTETDEDLAAINSIVRLVRKEAKGLNFNITVSPFVPKAQTAFQWVAMARPEEIARKIDFLKGIVPASLKAHNHRASVLEAFMAKGDRRVSAAVYKAWQKGARFDQWADKFGNDIWTQAIKESGLDLDFYVYRTIKEDEALPWDHLNYGVSKDWLYNDYLKGLKESLKFKEQTQNSDGSGAAGSLLATGGSFAAEAAQRSSLLPQNYVEPSLLQQAPAMRVLLRFSRKGAVRFISHLEQIEVLRRAARRCGLAVSFTAGFSPQVKSSFGPPVSVGHESSCEYMDLYFNEKKDLGEIKEKISAVLPDGFCLLSVKKIPLKFPAIDVLVNVAEFSIKNVAVLDKDVEKFMSCGQIIVEKTKKGKTVEIDAKPLIKNMQVCGSTLKMSLYFGESKSVKPEAVLKKLLENHANYATICNIERTNLYIETTDGEIYEP
ncbi:MAG: TIGR03960 family B12-binding radical SAM protein [Endomicrobium sp.]|jgi:radical SAM family uncharacterized protein/radical SAM-linked protein|nr:TIGR03960 family B12-binding radical SAM protein [Endomicrobium sp.]